MEGEIKLLGFNLTKVNIEKNLDFSGKLQINSSIRISHIEKQKLELLKEDALRADFDLEIDYLDLGKLQFNGRMILQVDSKLQKEMLKSWENKKELDKDIQLVLVNIVMQKASVKALQFEEELGLPPHIQIPRLRLGEESK